MSKPYRLIILDRDGVINHDSDDYIKSAGEWQPIAGSLAAIHQLCQAGFLVAVASNQAGVARGIFTQQALEDIHAKMQHLLASVGSHLADVRYCLEGPDSNSPRRKPNPGMLLESMEKLQCMAAETLFVGDSYTDFQAAERAACDFVLVKTGKGQRTLAKHSELETTVAVYEDLATLSSHLIEDLKS